MRTTGPVEERGEGHSGYVGEYDPSIAFVSGEPAR